MLFTYVSDKRRENEQNKSDDVYVIRKENYGR